MRGRWPAGVDYVDKLEGSAQAKQRAKLILQTLCDDLRLQEACTELAICPQRFHQLRQQMLQAAVHSLEPRASGRPLRPVESEEFSALRAHVLDLDLAVRVAQVREEIALALPGGAAGAEQSPEKKTPRRLRRRRRVPR